MGKKKKTRRYKRHSCPENAGEQNLPEGYAEKRKDNDKIMKGLYPIWQRSFKNREDYKGLWDEESLAREVDAFFRYCFENDVKPAKAGLQLWLDLSESQYYDWRKDIEKYGFKSEILRKADQLIEMQYIGRIEKYPTGNIFLLKSSHGHVPRTAVDINDTSKVKKEDVEDMVDKLGLDSEDSE